MLLKVCVNGARTPGEHPRLSASPEDVAAETADVAPIPVHPLDRPVATEAALDRAAEMVLAAQRPLVMVGAGGNRPRLVEPLSALEAGPTHLLAGFAEANAMVHLPEDAIHVRPGDIVLFKSSNGAGLRLLGDRIAASTGAAVSTDDLTGDGKAGSQC